MKSKAGSIRRRIDYLNLVAVNLLAAALLWQLGSPALLSKPAPVAADPVSLPTQTLPQFIEVAAGKPVRLVSPRLGIDLPVGEGFFDPATASWTLGGRQAYYAMPTFYANDYGGNTLIYGHNNQHVFGPMKRAGNADTVDVYTDNGHIFHYTFATSEVVDPTNLESFRYQGPPILTIQTCTGNWHEVRLMSVFKLSGVTKSQTAVKQARLLQLQDMILQLTSRQQAVIPALSGLEM